MAALLCALVAAAAASAGGAGSAGEVAAQSQPVLTDCTSMQGCAGEVLGGVLDGFTGAAGSSLWGWMLGGSGSAGSQAFVDDLNTIVSTLGTIATELGPGGPIVQAVEKLQCAEGSDWIAAGPAAVIDTWYAYYSNFLTALSGGQTPPLGDISIANTDITTLYGWANGVIQGNSNVASMNVLSSMESLNNLATAGSSSGTIADCLKASAVPPVTGTVDDRVYYSESVEPIQNYLLGLNTEAMLVLTEAYHIYAYADCVTANNGNTAPCTSPSATSASDVVSNLCPADTTSLNCTYPAIIYGQAGGQVTSGQLMPFLYAQFAAGGAPLSTDDYLVVNGTNALVVRSIEIYNAAAGANCPVPVKTACGPTYLDPSNTALPQYPVGPYGYGSPGNGRWVSVDASVFEAMMDGKFNTEGDNPDMTAGAFLCTLDTTGAGDPTNCMQPPPGNPQKPNPDLFTGMGLQYVTGKGFYFQDHVSLTEEPQGQGMGIAQCFLDGDLNATITGQPMCRNDRFQTVINRGDPNNEYCLIENPALQNASMGFFANYYQGQWCSSTDLQKDYAGWTEPAGYIVWPTGNAYPSALTWPGMNIDTLTCPNGKSPADPSNQSPVGVPALCSGSDFTTWFLQIVPAPSDADADGLADSADRCPNTTLPDSFAGTKKDKKDRYAADATGLFVDGLGTSSGYTVVDTRGCSGKQIIAASDRGKGYGKDGLTREALKKWVKSVN